MSHMAVAVPFTVPVTFDRPDRFLYGTATSVTRHPASIARSTISKGQPDRRSCTPRLKRSSRPAARMGPMSASLCPVRRHTSIDRQRFASRACSGHAPFFGRRAPSTRSAVAACRGRTMLGSARGSSDPSQSIKQTMSDADVVRPRQQAAPNPRRGSTTTCALSDLAICCEPSVDPLSTTIGWKPSGMRDSTHGNDSASSSTGRTTSGICHASVPTRLQSTRCNLLTILRTLHSTTCARARLQITSSAWYERARCRSAESRGLKRCGCRTRALVRSWAW